MPGHPLAGPAALPLGGSGPSSVKYGGLGVGEKGVGLDERGSGGPRGVAPDTPVQARASPGRVVLG